MQGLQGSFPRFKKCLPSNSKKRKMVIRSIVFIHIKTVSSTQDPEYEKFIAIKGHDKIKQYYFQADDYNTDSNDDDDDNNE
jgi:hypothetical protein